MKYVLNLPISGPLAAPRSLSALARTAEFHGIDVISSSERLVLPRSVKTRYPYGATGKFPGGTGSQKCLEMLTTLAFLCGQTSRVRILTSVLVLPYRDPILAAKMLATLDVLSQGRLIVGCGVGWMREEFEALGLPVRFEDRGRASDEYLRGMQELWCSENPEFKGTHVVFPESNSIPGRCSGLIRPSGSAERAPRLSVASPASETGGCPSPETPATLWTTTGCSPKRSEDSIDWWKRKAGTRTGSTSASAEDGTNPRARVRVERDCP